MSKRRLSKRDRDGEIAHTDFELNAEPGLLEDSSSEDSESDYSGLESEPDTTDEEVYAVEALEHSSDEEETDRTLEEADHMTEEADRMTSSWREAEETDTSDEEEIRNTVGNIPLEWYDDYPHMGYNIEGKPRPKPITGDELDEFLAKMDDPNYWRTVRDKATGKEVVLSEEQIDMIQNLQKSKFPASSTDPYEPYIDHFTHEKELHPLSSTVKPKSSFIPSRWEHKKIVKIAHAIRMGWIKPRQTPAQRRPKFYLLWGDSDQADQNKHRMHIPAPRMKLPGHAESYNPPPEYLPTQEEAKEWEELDPEDRKQNFLPQKYGSLREVPAYPKFIQERFERCLDLYLCPRQRKMRVQVDPEDLIPKLPRPRDLHPFPTTQAIVYKGHQGLVRCISVEPLGQWLASGSDDCSVRLWEVSTGRCVHSMQQLPGKPLSLQFTPNKAHTLLAIAVSNFVYLVNHGLGDRLVVSNTDSDLRQLPISSTAGHTSSLPTTDTPTTTDDSQSTPAGVGNWKLASKEEQLWGLRVTIAHDKVVQQVVWHIRGDYLATISANATGSDVIIHQLSKARSQNPFKRLKGAVQRVAFHPSKPYFFVATQTSIRVYDLVRQELVKKLLPSVKWLSSLTLHPSGDHLLAGSYDKRLCWFDLDLSTKPYKMLRHHRQAIRSVSCHQSYPLFASCSDDGAVIICHGRVFNDLLQNPQIVPVKMLKASSIVDGLGVLDCQFHPSQPWLFTAGADSTVRLFC